jgi:hypothetical protein
LQRRPIRGGLRRIGREQEAVLWARLEAEPAAILAEHGTWWEQTQGHHVSIATMARAIGRLGVDAKKRALGATERDEAARAQWRQTVSAVDPRRLVDVDASGTHTALTRLFARAPRGRRAHAQVPRHRGKTTT